MDKQKKKEEFKFSVEQREQLIDFVKEHEQLYKVQHREYKDAEAKERLWKEIGRILNKDCE